MSDELNKYDIPDSVWDDALKIMKDYIVDRIKSKAPYKFVSYSELSEIINSENIGLQLDGEGFNPILWALAGALSRNEDRAGRGMMSALIVHKTGDKNPGMDFTIGQGVLANHLMMT